MSPTSRSRELVVLGTAAQVPTRERNHVGLVLRWDGDAILFDPGESAQRQLLLAGVASHDLRHICITHFHGDHCLGLPGVLARLSLDRIEHRVDLHHPASGAEYVDRLRTAAVYDDTADVHLNPISSAGVIAETEHWTLRALPLDHSVETYGYRFEERPGRRFLPDRLAAAGLDGPMVGELERLGSVRVGGRAVHLDEVSVPRAAHVFAHVMDTRVCDNAVELARDADIVVCESTFLDDEVAMARDFGHLTARQAATIAREAGARTLVLAHYSQRHPDNEEFLREAAAIHPDVRAASDLDVIPFPSRADERSASATMDP